MLKDMNPSEKSDYTMVKTEFPNGWSEALYG